MWKNIVEPKKKQITIRHMSISRYVAKAKNTLSKYVRGLFQNQLPIGW